LLQSLLLAKLPPLGITSERNAAGLSEARIVDNYVIRGGNDGTFESPVIRAPQSFPNSLTMPPSPIPDEVAPFNLYLGVFLPYTPLHYLLLEEGEFKALVMTSGNLSEEPIAIDHGEAIHRLDGLADYFLVRNRDILLRCDDFVVRVARGVTRRLRLSRGFVPVPVFLKDDQPSVLAVGGELKNSVCLTKGLSKKSVIGMSFGCDHRGRRVFLRTSTKWQLRKWVLSVG
jgi:hypothetical protein